MSAYYNENDPFAAEWLRQLIQAGAIAHGDVDDRSIVDVTPDDLRPYVQCHFFAGIGVWSYALRQAGWSDDKPVWTGSCPCQPFSAAGKGGGSSDSRDLWWAFFWLISQCQPKTIFGEQVASEDALAWWDTVQTDMEGAGYAATAIDLCAAGIGAPHIRQRLFWVADSYCERLEKLSIESSRKELQTTERGSQTSRVVRRSQGSGDFKGRGRDNRSSPINGFWRSADWLWCRDNRWRPVEPGTFPLANGAPARVGRLRGYGNAIVAPLAQTFIEAYQEVST